MQGHEEVRKCIHTIQTQIMNRKYILAGNAAYEGIMTSWGLLDQRISRIIFRKNCITALLVVWCAFLPIAGLWGVKSVVKERYCMGRRACLCQMFVLNVVIYGS